jgi:hypothetical protein
MCFSAGAFPFAYFFEKINAAVNEKKIPVD